MDMFYFTNIISKFLGDDARWIRAFAKSIYLAYSPFSLLTDYHRIKRDYVWQYAL